MKKTLIFIVLKLGELLGFCGVLYLCYLLGNYTNPGECWYIQAFVGFIFGIGLPFATFLITAMIGIGIWELIKKNLEWADKLSNKGE